MLTLTVTPTLPAMTQPCGSGTPLVVRCSGGTVARSARQCSCWWHQLTISTYDSWSAEWTLRAEAAGVGYTTELAEFVASYPRPTFGAVLVALRQEQQR